MFFKRVVYVFIILILICGTCFGADEEVIDSQKDALGINNFLNETKRYNTGFENIDYSKLFSDAVSGSVNIDFMITRGFSILGQEVKGAINILGTVMVIIIIHSILKNISESLGNESTGKIAYFIQFILIIIILMKSYNEIIIYIKETISLLTDFTYILIPILISLIISTGYVTSGLVMQSIILFSITFISKTIINFIFPILVVSTVLGIISNISDRFNVQKLAKYFKSSIVWILCIVLTIFTGILSLETSLSQGVDQVSAKATKSAVSSFVPVVGKILGDTVETVLGCAGILKNTVGFIGIIGVIGICIVPIIRVGVLTVTYYLASGLCEVVADKKIVNILEQMGDSFKILFAIITSMSLMMIIGVTIIMKISLGT
ncbi:MAG: stage III sporulation protein AE [Clostridia bacterium]|nr:stage III sporulation protein AE [Clostridia bacterium]